MKFSVQSSLLHKKINKVIGVIGNSHAFPMLSNVLLSLEGDILEITATDIETTMSTRLNVVPSINGSICVNARILSDYLKAVPESAITFEVLDGNKIVIKNISGKQKLNGDDSSIFPKPEKIENPNYIEMTSSDFVIGVTKCMKSCGTDDLIAWQVGVNFNLKDNKLVMCATDALNLTSMTYLLDAKNQEMDITIPYKSILKMIKSVPTSEESVIIEYNEKNVSITSGDTVSSIRLLDGKYPNYKSIIPTRNNKTIRANKLELLSALNVSSVFTDKTASVVSMAISENKILITSHDEHQNASSAQSVECVLDFEEPISANFNSKTINKLISSVDTEDIIMQIDKGNTPMLIKNDDDIEGNSQLFLIMPVVVL
jgi:DNA polymerase-3 subunit beta